MSQHDLTINNQGFPAFRADLNDALQALGSTQSGTTAPSPTFANQLWYDTTNNILKIRNEDNDAWISLLTLDQSADSVSSISTATAVLSAGTVSLPSITTTGDTNTGIYFPAADTIAFTEGGVESMRIDSSGNVGIGTVSPAQKLDIASKVQIDTANAYGKIKIARATDSGVSALFIQGADNAGTANELSLVNSGGGGAAINITGGDLRFYATSNTTERMRIDTSGNVGIGTSSPLGKLEVRGSGNTALYLHTGNNSGDNSLIYFGDTGSATVGLLAYDHGTNSMSFHTNSSERMRIPAAGGLLVGTSVSAGEITNTSELKAGKFNTASGGTTAANNTATTLTTLPSGLGTYIVSLGFNGYGDATNFSAVSIINVDGTSTKITNLVTSSNMFVTLSGLNIQGRQVTGATLVISWSVLRIQ
jgi:hypothetical protein